MPMLYFATYRDDNSIYAKFGHCKNVSRLSAYKTSNPSLNYAMLQYDIVLPNYRFLDNYIYSKVLQKYDARPIVSLYSTCDAKHKSDWFYTRKEVVRAMLSYVEQLENINSTEDLDSFSHNIVFIITSNYVNAIPAMFKTGSILQLKEAQACPKWKHEYKRMLHTKSVNMCKSCKAKPAHAKCCPESSKENKKKVIVIAGWQPDADDLALSDKYHDQCSKFFERNFLRGGMIPLKEVKRHIEWDGVYIKNANVKDVNECKSCGAKPAFSGCCPQSSKNNRKKIRQVIGWHARTNPSDAAQ